MEKTEIENEYNWWDKKECKQTFDFPISIINDGEWWVATCNDETAKLIGGRLHGCAQGKTKEEAIKRMFEIIKITHNFSEREILNYQRWVPFRKGDWKHTGGKWFVIFGIHIYFRYGNGMMGGRYIPFTKLNISFSNEWKTFKKFNTQSK